MFETAFHNTMKHEGGYVHDPDDPGGETYRGIARRSHPRWEGWALVDKYKHSPAFPAAMDADALLKRMVFDFYETHYWKPVGGSMHRNQTISNEMFDMAVHMGVQRAVIFLQRALNALNREEKLYPNIVEDGDLGPQTRATMRAYYTKEAPALLHKLLVIQRGAFYLEIVRKRERSEKFLRGWLRRVKLR